MGSSNFKPETVKIRDYSIRFLKNKLIIRVFKKIGLGYQDKDIVFRFIIEYSSLRHFGP
jgi:hypothetical protein